MLEKVILQIPALLVVLPLVGAPLMMLVYRRGMVYALTSLIMYVNVIFAFILMHQVRKYGVISYHFGGWAPPIGIEFRIDHLSAIILLFVTLSTAIMMPWMYNACKEFIENKREYLFFVLLLLNYAGLLGMAATNDAFNLFVFLEISSLSTYAMIALGKERRGIMAAFNYLLMGTIGATFYIIAVSMLYQSTGSLNISDMAARLSEQKDSRTLFVALAFIFTGFALKAAIFPLHAWLPRAYAYAPDPTTTFLAATATKVSLYALIRMGINFFEVSSESASGIYSFIFITLGMAAMIIGAASATRQHNLKQILAFSSISQMGYMVMAIGFSFSPEQAVSDAGIVAATVHMFNHAILKGLLFMAVGAMAVRGISPWLIQLQGRARDMPITMGLFIIGGFGLIGVPGSIGFISKWYLIRMAVLQEHWFAVIAILATSALAFVYFWRIIEVGFMMKPHPKAPKVKEAPKSMLASMMVSAAIVIILGVYSNPLTGFIKNIPDEIRNNPPQKIIVPMKPLSKSAKGEGDH